MSAMISDAAAEAILEWAVGELTKRGACVTWLVEDYPWMTQAEFRESLPFPISATKLSRRLRSKEAPIFGVIKGETSRFIKLRPNAKLIEWLKEDR
jgi:hypothetical protein